MATSEPGHEQHAAIKDHDNAKTMAPFTMLPQINSDVTLLHFNVFLEFHLFVCSYNACRKEGFYLRTFLEVSFTKKSSSLLL